MTDFLTCPKCNEKKLEVFWINFPEGSVSIFHCTNCGYQGQGEPQEGNAPKTEPKPKPEPKTMKATFIIDKDLMKMREQDSACNKKGRMCVSIRSDKNEKWQPMCEGITLDENKKIHFDLKKCKKAQKDEKND